MKTIEQKAKKVPAIRFTGFDDAWVEKKIFDVAEIVGGGTPSTANPQFWDGNIDWYAPAEINDQVFVNGSERKITKLGLENSSAKVLPANRTVLFTSRAGIGKTAILQSPAATNQGFQSLVLNDDADTYFVYSMTDKIKAKAERIASGSTFAEISGKMLGNLELVFPSKKEQSKIGSFFSNIDSLISLEQKKYDKLTQVKKSMLEKMFPKEGATVPEIRFVGFTGDWEEKKLSDEFVDFIVPMRDKPKSFDGKIPWTRIEDIEGKFLNSSLSGQYVSEKTIAQMNLKVIPKNSLIVSSSATFGVVAVVTQDLITNQTFIGLVPNDKESLDFWYIFFYSDKAREYMKSQSAGSTIFYIARESFENMPVMIPSREEQQKIGSYFSHLDSLISLQQRKLEKLKNIKKSLLEKMFA